MTGPPGSHDDLGNDDAVHAHSLVVPPQLGHSRRGVVFDFRGVQVEARNLSAVEVIVDVRVRRLSQRAVRQAVRAASDSSAELKSVSPAALDSLGAAISSELASTAGETSAGEAVQRAIVAAMRANPEFAGMSEEVHAAILVRLIGEIPREQRDVALPVLALQSAEKLGRRTVAATWALVGVTIGLVVATLGLIVATVLH